MFLGLDEFKCLTFSCVVEKFEELDDQFKELAAMLNFRDKDTERREYFQARKAGTLPQEDKEMDDWDKEMKVCMCCCVKRRNL